MAVLSAAILTKSGKVLLARHFVDITRLRIEGILAAFPKLIESEGAGKQHTYVETGGIRYLYQPLENIHIVIVTTRGSNIVQDLDTLRLFSQIVPEYIPEVNEQAIAENVFDLCFALDELIILGHKDDVSLDAIRENLKMDSHNEMLFQMVHETKVGEAQMQATNAAIKIKQQKLRNQKLGGMGNTSLGGMTGFGGEMGGYEGIGPDTYSSGQNRNESLPSNVGSGSIYDSGRGGAADVPAVGVLKLGGKGLTLGASKAKNGLSTLEQVAKEDKLNLQAIVSQKSSKADPIFPATPASGDAVNVTVSESVVVVFDKDGALHKVEIKGVVQLLCSEEGRKLKLIIGNSGATSAFTFTPHPNLSKPDFANNNCLQMKNPEKPFPKGKVLGLLKWRYAAKDDTLLVPLKILCWPESNADGTCTVSLELELLLPNMNLSDVVVSVPVPSSTAPEISSIDGGTLTHEPRHHLVRWEVGSVDSSNPSCTAEFIVPGQENNFFPVTATFSSQNTICPIEVSGLFSVETEEPVHFGLQKELKTDRYEIIVHE